MRSLSTREGTSTNIYWEKTINSYLPREVRCERCLSWVQKGLYSRDQLRVDCSYTVVF